MADKAKILLVDDEPGMLRYIKTLLEVDDHNVQTAATGEEALEKVQKGLSPDLVLLDLLMPGIDGLETLESLRKLQPGAKVVMLSCVNDTKKVVQAIRLGATSKIMAATWRNWATRHFLSPLAHACASCGRRRHW